MQIIPTSGPKNANTTDIGLFGGSCTSFPLFKGVRLRRGRTPEGAQLCTRLSIGGLEMRRTERD